MKRTLVTLFLLCGLFLMALLSCTGRDTTFNPEGKVGISVHAFVVDSLVSGSMTYERAAHYAAADTLRTGTDTATFVGWMQPADAPYRSHGWTFGDGQISSESMVRHAYAASGVYRAVFTVEDNAGFSLSDTVRIVVNTPPGPVTLLSPDSGRFNVDPGRELELRWSCLDADGDSLLYWVYFNNTSDLVAPSFVTSDSHYTLPISKLSKLTTYFWTVRAFDKYGDTSIADTFYFRTKDPNADTTAGDIAGRVLRQDLDSSLNRGIRVVVVSAGVEKARTITDDSGYYHFSNLSGNVRVHFTDSAWFSADSSNLTVQPGIINTITPVTLLDAMVPVITLSANDTVRVNTGHSVHISARDTFYTVDSLFADFGSGYQPLGGPDTTVQYATTGSHWIRVRARDIHGLVRVESLLVYVNQPPSFVVLVQPINLSESGMSTPPYFSWNTTDPDNAAALKYSIFVGRSAVLAASDIKASGITGSSYGLWNPGNQTGRYYWKIEATDGFDTIASSTDSFKIVDYSSIMGKCAGVARLQGVHHHQGVKITLQLDNGSTFYSTRTDPSGFFSFPSAFPGIYTLTATDTLRNEFQPAVKTITVVLRDSLWLDTLILADASKPVITLTYPMENDTLDTLDQSRLLAAAGTLSDSGSKILPDSVRITLNGRVITPTSVTLSQWSFSEANMPDGRYTLVVAAQDSAGNRSDPMPRNFYVNSKQVTFALAPNELSLLDSTTLAIDIDNARSPIRVCYINYDAQLNSRWDDSILAPAAVINKGWRVGGLEVPDGLIRIRVVDDSGFYVEKTQSYRVHRDAPTVVAMADTLVAANASVTVHAVAQDSAFGTIRQYYWDKGLDGWDDSTLTGVWTLTGPGSGPIRVRVGAIDDDGLFAYDTFTVNYNRIPSLVNILSPANHDTLKSGYNSMTKSWNVAIRWSGTDADRPSDTLSYSLYVYKTIAGRGATQCTGRDTFYAAVLDSSTRYTVEVRATDKMGDTAWSATSLFFIPSSLLHGMIMIPGGTFAMGQAGIDEPVHDVTLSDFWMDTTEVTQSEFLAVTGVNPSLFTGTSTRPVENVTWFDAVLFANARSLRDSRDTVYSYTAVSGTAFNGCDGLTDLVVHADKNGYRLPTEAEWEYACRAGTSSDFYWGSGVSDDNAWYSPNSAFSTHEVAQKGKNALGLYDMSGNVWEWCSDWDSSYVADPQTDPFGPVTGSSRIIRGGAWNSSEYFLHSGGRNSGDPAYRDNPFGFRMVCYAR